jgi:glycosyltransferase involved in cell wall biosynthesis
VARILVITSHPPFAEGGHLVIARELAGALEREGHRAELWLTPQNRFGRQGAAYLATWLTDVAQSHDGAPVDQVITLRFPSYAVRHPRHVCWLNHTMREYYDRWPAFSQSLSRLNRVKEQVRRTLVHGADRWLLGRNVARLFVQSETVNRRLSAALGLRGDVLHPPAPVRPYRCEAYEPYLFAVSRLTRLKRLDLLVEALVHAPSARLVVAGEGEDRAALDALAHRLGVAARLQLVGRIGEVALLDHLARSRAVCFTPLDEDFGFVTTEAFASAKPVITCADSGGPAELVRDGVEGRVCAPTAEAVGAAMQALSTDEALARAWGRAARERGSRLDWRETVRRLVIV